MLAVGEDIVYFAVGPTGAAGPTGATGSTGPTGATDTITYTAVGTVSAGTFIHSRVTIPYNHANQPPAKNDHLFIKVTRNATSDTYSGTVMITAYEYIWTADALTAVF
jgi:hypothetical protein